MSTYRTSCGETLEKLPLYVGGDLDPEALAGVRAHLDACASCARRARAAQRAREELAGSLRSPGMDPSEPSLWPSIRGTLQAEGLIRSDRQAGRTPKLVRARSRRGLRWLVPIAAAAALVAVVQGAGLLDRAQPALNAPPPPQVAAPEPPHAGTLRRIDPLDVEPLVPFKASRPELGNSGWLARPPVSAVGFRR